MANYSLKGFSLRLKVKLQYIRHKRTDELTDDDNHANSSTVT